MSLMFSENKVKRIILNRIIFRIFAFSVQIYNRLSLNSLNQTFATRARLICWSANAGYLSILAFTTADKWSLKATKQEKHPSDVLLLWRLSTRGHSAGSLLGTTNAITSWSEQSRAECELVNNYKCQGNLYIPCLNHQTSVAVLALNVPLQSGSICKWVCGSHCSDLASILMLNHFGKKCIYCGDQWSNSQFQLIGEKHGVYFK